MKPKFPLIMYIDDVLAVYPEEATKVKNLSFPDDNTMLCLENGKKHGPGWLVDVTGQFRQLKPLGKRREWARPLSFLWQFVLSEYSITENRSITIGELRSLIENIDDPYPEAPIAEDLRRFLKQYGDDVIVSEELLRKWPI